MVTKENWALHQHPAGLCIHVFKCSLPQLVREVSTCQLGSRITDTFVYLSQIRIIPFRSFTIRYRPTVWIEYKFALRSLQSVLSAVWTAVTLPSCKMMFWSYKLKGRFFFFSFYPESFQLEGHNVRGYPREEESCPCHTWNVTMTFLEQVSPFSQQGTLSIKIRNVPFSWPQ